jgi:antitoxin HicB
MRQSPTGWRIEDLMDVAERNGIQWRRPGRGGSHVTFSAPGIREIVSVPWRGQQLMKARKDRSGKNQIMDEYRVTVRPLSKAEGGGYLAEYPEIPGCMSDGETVEEAIRNGREALRDCLEVFKESGRKAPKSGVEAAQWRQRLPRTLYLKLTERAKSEGVSINSLVTAMIAESIGSRSQPRKNYLRQ